ncbi:MAG: Riboflavin transporter, partial [Alphaproteobacteria bacterium MarineAlpha5_Bin8]
MKQSNIFLGITFMIASVFTLGINDIIVKGLSYKFPIWEIVFFRAISGAIISIGLVLIFGINSIKTKKPIGHLFRAFSAVACVVLFFFGIKLLLLAENQALFHSAPIIASILAVPILGEKIGFHRIFAIIIGFLGVLVILKPGTDLFNLYSLISLGSGFFAALTYLSTRYLMS